MIGFKKIAGCVVPTTLALQLNTKAIHNPGSDQTDLDEFGLPRAPAQQIAQSAGHDDTVDHQDLDDFFLPRGGEAHAGPNLRGHETETPMEFVRRCTTLELDLMKDRLPVDSPEVRAYNLPYNEDKHLSSSIMRSASEDQDGYEDMTAVPQNDNPFEHHAGDVDHAFESFQARPVVDQEVAHGSDQEIQTYAQLRARFAALRDVDSDDEQLSEARIQQMSEYEMLQIVLQNSMKDAILETGAQTDLSEYIDVTAEQEQAFNDHAAAVSANMNSNQNIHQKHAATNISRGSFADSDELYR